MEDGYEFFARRQLVTLFSAPNYCGDYDNAGGMMTIDEELMCSFQVRRRRGWEDGCEKMQEEEDDNRLYMCVCVCVCVCIQEWLVGVLFFF